MSSKAPRTRVLDVYGDGRWHDPHDVAEELRLAPEAVRGIVVHAISNGRPRVRAVWERRRGSYRLISANEKSVSLGVLTDELTPIIAELREQGKRRLETISIGDVAAAAARLQKLLDSWAE